MSNESAKVTARDGVIRANGRVIGRYQRLTIGGYEIRLDHLRSPLSSHYKSDIPRIAAANLQSQGQIMSQRVATFRPALAKYTRWARGSFGSQQYEIMDTGWQIETPDGVKLEPMTKSAARKYVRERGWSVRVELPNAAANLPSTSS